MRLHVDDDLLLQDRRIVLVALEPGEGRVIAPCALRYGGIDDVEGDAVVRHLGT